MTRRAALLLCCLAPLGAAETRPLHVDDILAVKDVAAPQISPDGKC